LVSHLKNYLDAVDNYLWYKDAIIYELHVRAFYDSNGDGIGDFRGLIDKLDYLQDLGVNAIWLLPFYPSPLKDDGYDIADYTDVHPNYGSLRDFKTFLREAGWRGIRVITELILNHTSFEHPWFQRSRRSEPGSRWRDFYVWSDTPEKYRDARIIFKDFEHSNWAWDPVARSYYWHRFYSHQPDLNYDHNFTREAINHIVDFWLNLGVAGLRLDAVPYLYEREGTNCENLPQTHSFIKDLRRYIDQRHKNTVLLAEANQWPEDAAAYLGEGDECHMAFHFPLMPRMFMATRMEDRFPIIDILQQTPKIPDICQWALFLRNHDEMTLEMVTDEERDYMYRVYAQDPNARINLGIRRRLAPLLNNDRKKIELMNALLFSLPGTPVIYYGDEIGMGDNFFLGDRNGVRTPMQWSADRNAGFSPSNPQRLYLPIIIDPEYHYESINVDNQERNPDSLLWWMKRMISMRKRFKAFSRGNIEFLLPENRKVLSFLRRYQDENVLVVANLSRLAQQVSLDLSPFKDMTPVEIFGQTGFHPVGDAPYVLTLAPHSFYWFSLVPPPPSLVRVSGAKEEPTIPAIHLSGNWENLFKGRVKASVIEMLTAYIKRCSWFIGKGRKVQSSEISNIVKIPSGSHDTYLILIKLDYTEGDPETYLLPVATAEGNYAEQILSNYPNHVIGRLQPRATVEGNDLILYDALCDSEFCNTLLAAISGRRTYRGTKGELKVTNTSVLRKLKASGESQLEPSLLKTGQSATSVAFGNHLILKFMRRMDAGVSPELEVDRFLWRNNFPHIPPLAGSIEYVPYVRSESETIAVLHGYVQNVGDAWQYTLDHIGRYFEWVLAHPDRSQLTLPQGSLLSICQKELPPLIEESLGTYFTSAQTLGQRTAELHIALSSDQDDADFAPEPFSLIYQRSVFHAMRGLTMQTLPLLKERMKFLRGEAKPNSKTVLEMEDAIIKHFQTISKQKIKAMRTRCHGNYHLGQVLNTGNDFVIIDFEGEPARSLGERRLKRSPLTDVAGMIRSFHYAVYQALSGKTTTFVRSEDQPVLEPMARLWYLSVSSIFLKSYLESMAETHILPDDPEELEILLNAYLLEKAIYEVGFELVNRPDWVNIPLLGILEILEGEQ